MGIFEEFEARKAIGGGLYLDDLIQEELRKMFIDEQISD